MRKAIQLWVLCMSVFIWAGDEPGEQGNLGSDRIQQEAITSGQMSLHAIRKKGRQIFSTPFNHLDGYGDGPMDYADPTTPGGRPTLQNNGTYLRVNGLDGQTCLDCHSIVSNASIPATFGVGGVGGSAANAIALPTEMDVDDEGGFGYAFFNGRFINPPFLFGSGGVELLGKEMTRDLQRLKQQAQAQPGTVVELISKGIHFGFIRYENGEWDTSQVEGIDEDLVVRPFGRKGEFISTRAFDIEAMRFHFGMQPVEFVGKDVDADGDGVVNEILVGELSALSIFNTTLNRPFESHRSDDRQRGFDTFVAIGCADCHSPSLETESRELTYSFPEVDEDPSANVYYSADLSRFPTNFDRSANGGLVVPLFSDLKRHNMGPDLAESTGGALDPLFITARLWGVADTAPYLHDGRAQTLTRAIMLHGGEAEQARDAFEALPATDREAILAFLRGLRTPKNPGSDLSP
ncbi:MAG: hypothetical protein H6510_07730 [Acidobacteria bacterium]|nr:hypothetical protein [Acidobacteriota bacterium]MCB9397687.1 hypothetical protein [Acidobacteriota bacterium]